MDFFATQSQALRKTGWLVFLFAMAVMCFIALAYLGLSLWVIYGGPMLKSPDIVHLRTIVILLIICAITIFKGGQLYRFVALVGMLCIICMLVIVAFAFRNEPRLVYVETKKPQIQSQDAPSFRDGNRLIWVCLIVGGGISAASLYKIRQISRFGGKLIAEQLGGRMIARNTQEPEERRLINVVDEMSIAAGIPAPVAFALDKEPGLNAFAAGLTTRNSVIGVTRGLLETMNRDELQGVIAHEISHIVNGDSRLNLKLIGVLYGIYILTIMGRNLISDALELDDDDVFYIFKAIYIAVLFPFGLAMSIIGFIGLFFGRLIQSAVSRQREYLADASAAQFTRFPFGLSSALKKLQKASSEILHPEAAAASHLFFGAGSTSLFNTHPPLAERIRRLDGVVPNKSYKKTLKSAPASAFREAESIPILVDPHAAMTVFNAVPVTVSTDSASGESLIHAQILLSALPKTLRKQTRHVFGATGILGGLLFSEQPDIRARQEKMLSPLSLPTALELYQWLSEQSEHGAQYRLVWLDLILPTLREALDKEQQELVVLANDLIYADGRVCPTEFALYSLLCGALLQPEQRVKQSELNLEQLDNDISDLLAFIAYAGHEDEEMSKAAYQSAIVSSPAEIKYPFPVKVEISPERISEALSHIVLTAPPYRKKFLLSCEVAVRHDGKIAPVENELLRAFAQSLDCPAPLMQAW